MQYPIMTIVPAPRANVEQRLDQPWNVVTQNRPRGPKRIVARGFNRDDAEERLEKLAKMKGLTKSSDRHANVWHSQVGHTGFKTYQIEVTLQHRYDAQQNIVKTFLREWGDGKEAEAAKHVIEDAMFELPHYFFKSMMVTKISA